MKLPLTFFKYQRYGEIVQTTGKFCGEMARYLEHPKPSY